MEPSKVAVNGLDRSRYEAAPYNRPLGYTMTEMDLSYSNCAIEHECAARAVGAPFALTRIVFGGIVAIGDLAYTSITAVGSSVASSVTCCRVESVNDYTKKQWKHCGTSAVETLCFPLFAVCCPVAACGLMCCAPQVGKITREAILTSRAGTAVPVRQAMTDAMDQIAAAANAAKEGK